MADEITFRIDGQFITVGKPRFDPMPGVDAGTYTEITSGGRVNFSSRKSIGVDYVVKNKTTYSFFEEKPKITTSYGLEGWGVGAYESDGYLKVSRYAKAGPAKGAVSLDASAKVEVTGSVSAPGFGYSTGVYSNINKLQHAKNIPVNLVKATYFLGDLFSKIAGATDAHVAGRLKQGQSPLHCFPSDTLILSHTGECRVAEICAGDFVLSFDPFSKSNRSALIPKKVIRTFTNITEEWLRLTWLESGKEQELVTTPGHQFLAAQGGFREIESLVAGGKGTVVLTDGSLAEVTAERIVFSAATADMFEQAEGYVYPENGNLAMKPVYKKGWKTYNFEVEDYHTYVAGGVRVHNDSYNDGTGFEYHGFDQRDDKAYVELHNGRQVSVSGEAFVEHQSQLSESYRSTAGGKAQSAAYTVTCSPESSSF